MLYAIIAFFALAAIGGMALLSFVLSNKETPKAITAAHGLFAVTGLVLLLVYTFGHSPGPVESVVLFVIAAMGGIILVARDLAGKKIPKWLAVAHGLIAVSGFVFLLVFAFGQ